MKTPLLAQIFVALWSVLVAIACQETRAPEKIEKPKPKSACIGGISDDPPRAQIEIGVFGFEQKKYKDAQKTFAELRAAYPRSGTVLVWLADAYFYDKELHEDEAARLALPLYDAAGRLHETGCSLPRRARYYELIGIAYARLRLARTPGPSRAAELEAAETALASLEAEFPTSAEVTYTQARVACLRVPDSGAQADVQARRCYERFERTIRISEGYERPRFLRTFRSTEDWIVRSETQSEFGPLRAQPRYRELVGGITRSPL